MTRRLLTAVFAAAILISASVSAVLAGEVTGNGKLLHVDGKWGTGLHARSLCAYSGQEDLQYFTEHGDGPPVADPIHGDPAHAQSWGQIPKAVRDSFPAFLHPGEACNPIHTVLVE